MKKRCVKKGHREKERAFRILCKSSEFRCVATLYERTEKYCARCGEVFKKHDRFIMSYQGITLPRTQYEQLYTQGWVRI